MASEVIGLPEEIKGISPGSVGAAIAFGIGLNGLGQSFSSNLLPPEARIKDTSMNKQVVVAIIASVLLLFAAIFNNIASSQIEKSKYEAVLAQGNILPITTKTLSVEEIERRADNTTTKLKFLRALADNRGIVAGKLSQLVTYMPDGVWVKNIALKNIPYILNSGRTDSSKRQKLSLSFDGGVYVEDASSQSGIMSDFINSLKGDKVFMRGFSSGEVASLDKSRIGQYEFLTYVVNFDSNKSNE